MTPEEKEKIQRKAQAFKDFAKEIFVGQISSVNLGFTVRTEEELKQKQRDLSDQINTLAISSVAAAVKFNRVADEQIRTLFSK